jgi:multiple sugar transport system substrate-binding protein/raffinose/stachyose/melibiose transport system substrate-binding protein
MSSKKLSRRDFLRLGALTAAGAALAGCCPSVEPTTEEVVVTQIVEIEGEQVEVTKVVKEEVQVEKNIVIYNSMHGDPLPREADEELVQMFEEKYPDFDVVHSIVAHEDFKQAIRAYLTASTPPDVMTWFAGNRARFFIDKGLILDISDVWEAEGWNDDYAKGFRALSTVDGKQYFVPTSWYWWAVYYRPSIFAEYGLEPPATWDEFLQVCQTLKDNGVTPLTIGTKYRWTAAAWFDYINMRVNGPEFHIDLMLGKEKYDDPRVLKVFTDYWAPLIENGYFLEDAAAYSWQEGLQFMIDGSAAMYLMGDFVRDSFPDELEDDLDFFQFPIVDPSVPVGEDAPTDGYFIAAGAQNPEGAKAFLAFLGSVEMQQYFAEKLGRLSTHTGVDVSVFSPQQQKGIAMMETVDYVAQFYDRDTTPEMADEGMNGFMEFWDSPGNIADILTSLEQTRQEVFESE